MKIKNLPRPIQDLVFEESKGYVKMDDDIAFSATIDWSTTKDGFEFWHDINKGNYAMFEERYGALESSIDNFSII